MSSFSFFFSNFVPNLAFSINEKGQIDLSRKDALNNNETKEETNNAKEQMMEICCPHCHENVTVNVTVNDLYFMAIRISELTEELTGTCKMLKERQMINTPNVNRKINEQKNIFIKCFFIGIL